MCASLPSAGEIATAFATTFVAGSAVSALVASGVYAFTERRSRHRWWQVPAGSAPAASEAGPFRDGGAEVPVFHERAPADLRWTSYLAIALGLWAIPLVPVALLLLAFVGAGVLLAPTVLTGFWLVSAGRGLLQRRPSAGPSALDVAKLLRTIGIVHLVGIAALTLLTRTSPLVALPYFVPFGLCLAMAARLTRTVRKHFPEVPCSDAAR